MDKCREEFELFWINRCKELEIKCVLTRSAIDGDYLYINANYAWIGWKASRENMKAIKFPEELTPEYEGDGYKSRYEEAYCRGYNQALRDCEKQITSALYKVE